MHGGTTDPRVKDVAGNALAASFSWTFTIASGTGGCTGANPIVVENCLAGNPSERMGHLRRRRHQHPGLRDRHQRQSRQHGLLQGRYQRSELSLRHLPHGLLRRAGRAQGRDRQPVGEPAAEPADLPERHHDRPDRLRQLGRLRLMGRTGQRDFGHLLRQGRAHRHRRREPHRLRRPRRREHVRPLLFQTSDTTWQAYNK